MPPKRDYKGNTKFNTPKVLVVRNEYTPMFERFRDELDEHHDRRERIVKASRDITALSKKIIFALQRVRKIQGDLPGNIEKETQSRLLEISRLLSTIAPDVQGINRYRYSRSLMCIEELIEALTFAQYMRTQGLMGYDEAVDKVAKLSRYVDEMEVDVGDSPHPSAPTALNSQSVVHVTEDDYLGGVFDLSGELMRFATTSAALTGKMAGGASATTTTDGRERTIVVDVQDLGSFFEMLPQQYHKGYQNKLETLRTSVLKVEKLGYGLTVRGSERPAGWMPDEADDRPVGDDE
ncbi:Translin-associated protein X [Cytospora mali]|uniref:Translin-associated protein X n=1 Tax=Cytospora mali TaxID=578113 RepID=A0A194VJX8_CYTMA|nr:Translin-associated protein X [Valsa mali]KUI64434.1 Translin-associated protein X [Valsa mali]